MTLIGTGLILVMQTGSLGNADPGRTIGRNISAPPNCVRTEVFPGSFAAYLRDLPLKPPGAKVKLFDGRDKASQVQAEVVDLPIGTKDLHQCADAVIRLRADYLYQTGQQEKICFEFTNGFRADYDRWRQGWRIWALGTKAGWGKAGRPSDTPKSYWGYLEMVFRYAGTLSLSRELEPVVYGRMEPGDVLIQGGSPGHAVIVVDMARDTANGQRYFLLAQSYMPAQEIHVLKNPVFSDISPWYRLKEAGKILTPEWTFLPSDLKRFPGQADR